MAAVQQVLLSIASVASSAAGQIAYTAPGTYNWTVPAGVTSICAVCVQPGGSYVNNNPAGTTVTYNSVIVCRAQNGNRIGDGGGDGGIGGAGYNDGTDFSGGGGGGAGGYNGNGGNGGPAPNSPGFGAQASSGGASGGAGASPSPSQLEHGYNGGGVGILGQGATGTTTGQGGSGGGNGGTARLPAASTGIYGGGAGGEGGGIAPAGRGGALSYKNNIPVTPGTTVTIFIPETPLYAGGGAARIIWGAGRAFPSTNTGDL